MKRFFLCKVLRIHSNLVDFVEYDEGLMRPVCHRCGSKRGTIL